VWVRDDRGQIKEKYHITHRARAKGLDGSAVIEVTGRSLLYQLARENVANFYAGTEQQVVTLPSGVTAGNFTLTFRGVETSNIAYNASAGTVQTALEALSNIEVGDVTVSGSAGGPYTLTWAGQYLEKDAAQVIFDGSGLTGGVQGTVATTRTTKTLREVVDSLLDQQVNTLPILLGAIDTAIGDNVVQLKIENKSIMAALLELRDLYGGYFWVNPSNRKFYWKRRQGRNTGQYIRIGKNGQHIEEIEDYSAMANRITALGKGETIESTLSVTVNDTTSQSSYGIVADTIVDKSIWNTTDLTAFANANLQARKVPKKSYRIGVIDLARLTSGDYQFFELEVGSKIRVIDTEFGLTLDTTIATIERELDTGSTGGGLGGASGTASKVKIAVTNPDAGTTSWGGNEPSIIPAEERAIDDTIADIVDLLLDEVMSDTGFIDTLTSSFPEAVQSDAGAAIREAIGETVDQAIAAGTINVPEAGTGILTVAQANADGSSADFASVDHVHKGNCFTASDFASLPSEAVASIGVTTGSLKYAYVRIDGSTWLRLSHI